MKKYIGLDAGSVSVKVAVLDNKGNILQTRYVRHKGKPLTVAYELLHDLEPSMPLGITGSAGRLLAGIFNIKPVNEIVAQSYSTKKLYPEVRTIIEMGGEDSKLILLDHGRVKEFSMNSVCAAGTGSFLDQQAERLRLTIEEFGEIALESKNPPRIAGRCSVFAKSDMIHLQQIATPLKDIVAGLCFAVARNFKGSICKNMELPLPVSFQGGVSANKGVVRAFKEIFSLEQLAIPEHFALMPAIGAALKNIEDGIHNTYDINKLEEFISSARDDETGGLEPLRMPGSDSPAAIVHSSTPGITNAESRVKAFMGIDVGSISTNLAVIDEKGSLLAKIYLMTAGNPIEAVRQGLEEIGGKLSGMVDICGVGTTGSGRYMIADFIGADIVKNEITAQARAAISIDPLVDTIFEIGGQDSKYISIKDGIIVDFEMNKACAAGTGSFLEEQADKLGISIKKEFSDLAFQSTCPSSLGERCTVFMENSLLARQQRGVPKESLVAGLSYSIVQNYINRVVGAREIGKRIFFQGGTAFNKAVVDAFGKYTGQPITVPPNHDVTGAIGMALIAMEHMKDRDASSNLLLASDFKGFDLSRTRYEVKSFECKGCDNLCEINRVKIDGEKDPLFYGSRCEKYDVKRKKKHSSDIELPDLFAERERLLAKAHIEYKDNFEIRNLPAGRRGSKFEIKDAIRIGIPRIFFFHDFLPFWSTFLWELGFSVETSDETKRHLINKGVESILSESCFPHKVAHGHIKDLIDRGVDAILIPSFINLNPGSKEERGYACPYVQTMPYVAQVAFKGNGNNGRGIQFLRPVINLELGEKSFLHELYRTLRPFNIPMRAIRKAADRAGERQEEFFSSIKRRGREILSSIDKKTIVILGRSYNAFDPGVNLEIPKKLSEIGVFSIPMDYLPLGDVEIHKIWPNMYWRSGQNLLRAAEIIRDNPNLFALYIGNFSCGPDSFIQRFFKESLAGKPYLHIEIDEHSADAGVITRCEAFLDSIKNRKNIPLKHRKKVRALSLGKDKNNKLVYISKMSDHALGLAAAFESCGIDAEVMDKPDINSVKAGRKHVSGKECYPCAVTTGDMVKRALSNDFDPERAVFFMPSGSGPCRFGQYNIFHRLVLDEIGFPDVPIFSPNQDSSFYMELGIVGKDFSRQAWKGVTAIDLLMKCLHETRPYEVNPGETEHLYNSYLKRVTDMVRSHNGKPVELLRDMNTAFSRVPKNNGKRPLIGIIGEIFVRHNTFSNEDLIKKVETLGGEVWLAPLEEWIYYVNLMASRKALLQWKKNIFSRECFDEVLSVYLTRFVQRKIEHKFSQPFSGSLRTRKEPSTKEILNNASPYLQDSFEGETILSIGKAVDFVKNGASGIISAMPFGCMPGTIVGALLKGVKQDTGIPFLSIAYDGAEANCSELQIEAFIHQAIEYDFASGLKGTGSQGAK
jgi:predicted CoA-substrate-specific enzyme activase